MKPESNYLMISSPCLSNVTQAEVLTPPGAAGIAVIRISGPQWETILYGILDSDESGKTVSAAKGTLFLKTIRQKQEILDHVLIALEPEGDGFEIHCHGGPRIIQRILMMLQNHQVEIVSSGPEQEFNGLSREIFHALTKVKSKKALLAIAAQQENGLGAWLAKTIRDMNNQSVNLPEVKRQIKDLRRTYVSGKYLLSPPTVVFSGEVNVGKSSIVNALGGREQSLSSELAGTTRDWTEQLLEIDGVAVQVIDTAGLCESTGELEQYSQEKTQEKIRQADIIVVVVSPETDNTQENGYSKQFSPPGHKTINVVNKCDLRESFAALEDVVYVSALTGDNLDILRARIMEKLGFKEFHVRGSLIFTERQDRLLADALQAEGRTELMHYLEDMRGN